MKIHEYQAKDILAKYGVAVPRGEVANTLDEALEVARRLFTNGAKGVVVKAQIHAGGRGKGGGVKVAKNFTEAEEYAKKILGMQLITHQTGPQGQKVQRLLIEETAPIDRELYLGIVLDRAKAQLVFMASQAGGMEIEEVAAKDPDAIYKEYKIHNGTDPVPDALFTMPRPTDFTDRKIIFSAGMFYQRKGIPLLVEAFAKIADRHPSAVLRIAGDGVERPQIESAIRAGGLQQRVALLGKVSHETVLQEMVWSDAFALVGWDEPFATVFIEAMSAGKPVLCANDGGINDVVRDQEHGLTVPPRDVEATARALDAMLSDDAGRLRMGAAAKKLVEEHLTWDANADAMIKLFREAALRSGDLRQS